MQYVLGLDNGGTASKAAIFDLHGREVAVSARKTALLTPAPGFMERDMEQLWLTNCACARDVLDKSGIDPCQLAAIAVTGHGKGLYAWGKDGPVGNGILSSDNRAWKYPEKWRQDGTFQRLRPRLCQQLVPGQPAALLAWMKEHAPQAYQDIRWVFSVKDYIRYRLTGQAFSEVTDLSGSGLMNVKDARLDADMLEALGIGEVYQKLPPLRFSHEVCGGLTAEAARAIGLPEGTPVAGGMFDIDACALAMDVTSPQELCTITGTWSINEFIANEPVMDGAAMNSLYAIPGYYLVEECSPTGAGNLEWALQALLPGDTVEPDRETYRRTDELVAAISPEECNVYFLPFLYGSNGHPLGKAGFVGLTSYHNRGHMLRAVYEGAAYTAKVHIDRLLSVRGTPKAVRMGGGAARAPLWVQMFADILDLPVETVTDVKELGALGCAMAGFVAAGAYPDYKAAAREMVHIAPAIKPNPQQAEIYRQKYQKYRAVMAALDTVWDLFEV